MLSAVGFEAGLLLLEFLAEVINKFDEAIIFRKEPRELSGPVAKRV